MHYLFIFSDLFSCFLLFIKILLSELIWEFKMIMKQCLKLAVFMCMCWSNSFVFVFQPRGGLRFLERAVLAGGLWALRCGGIRRRVEVQSWAFYFNLTCHMSSCLHLFFIIIILYHTLKPCIMIHCPLCWGYLGLTSVSLHHAASDSTSWRFTQTSTWTKSSQERLAGWRVSKSRSRKYRHFIIYCSRFTHQPSYET